MSPPLTAPDTVYAGGPDVPWPLLQAVAALADAPLTDIAERLREASLPYLGSSALVIFTEDCTGRPQKKAGEEDIISRVSIAELDRLRAALSDEAPWLGEAEIAGQARPVLAMKYAPSKALLVLTDPSSSADPGHQRAGHGDVSVAPRCPADPGEGGGCAAVVSAGIPGGLR